MTDVVSRLRVMSFMICGEAADLIEAQAERIRVLRDALEVIHGQSGNDYAHDIFEARAIARAALEATR